MPVSCSEPKEAGANGYDTAMGNLDSHLAYVKKLTTPGQICQYLRGKTKVKYIVI